MTEAIENYTKRKQELKDILRELHEGSTVKDVQVRFSALLEDVGPTEIAEVEQELIDEGMPEKEIQRLCDVHVAVFRESLEGQQSPDTMPGHPVYTFLAENAAAGRVLDALEEGVEGLRTNASAEQLDRVRRRLEELQEYEVHYLRKENILFPYLEKHGFEGPSTVMWGIHDEVREGWKELETIFDTTVGEDASALVERIEQVLEPLATEIREMFYKEENILYPTALEKLSGEEWWQIRVQSADIGYCYVTPGDQWPPEEAALETVSALRKAERPVSTEGLLHLDTGTLSPEVVNLMLNHLPVEISFVDANDTVRFFTQTGERIFPRSPAIIGRKVQKCHPPASVHRVQEILNDFRAGRREAAEFWIQMRPADDQRRFIHIQYFAVRDDEDAYVGTVEVVQDVTHIRQLEGERRLLDDA